MCSGYFHISLIDDFDVQYKGDDDDDDDDGEVMMMKVDDDHDDDDHEALADVSMNLLLSASWQSSM